jgi:DNA gyrase subunit B
MTDADVDGSHIRTLLLTFFFRHMCPVIEHGYLYIAQPPLYKVKRGQTEMYLKNQVAFDDYVLQLATEKLRLSSQDSGQEVGGSDLASLVRRVQMFEQLLSRLERRRNDIRVLRQVISHDDLTISSLRDAAQTQQLLQTLQATLQRQCGDILREARIEWDEEYNCNRIIFVSRNNTSMLTTVIDYALLTSQDLRDLRVLEEQLKRFGSPPFTLQNGEGKIIAESFGEFLEAVNTAGKKDLNVQRYKGLGEMNPIQLWDTTMDPERRTLLQVTIEDAVEADNIFTALMGDQVDPRKAFIEKHAKEVVNLDI